MNCCAQCKYLFIVNSKDRWWSWLCMARPQPPAFNPVSGETVADPPYQTCKSIRYYEFMGKDCPEFKEGINSLSEDKLKVFVHTMEGRPLND